MFLLTTMTVILTACPGSDDEPTSSVVMPSNPDNGSSETDGSESNNSQLLKLLLNTWKCNASNGYKKYIFQSNGVAEFITYFDKQKTATSLNYLFDTSSMKLTLKDAIKGSESSYVVTRLTDQELVFGGDTYINVTGSSDEDEDDENAQGGNNQDDSPVRGPVAKTFRGDGTQSNPYIISDASELRKLSDDVASGMRYKNEYFKMTADVTINRNVLNANGDINASDSARFERWIPIGNNNYSFEGIFDGNGHTIYGIYINSESGGALFRRVNILKNLTLKDSYISGGYAVGFVTTMGVEITGCFNYATLVGRHTSGAYGIAAGISGYYNIHSSDNPSTIIDKCANYGKISGHYRAAGIVAGYSYNGSNTHIVKNCVNYGDISGDGTDVGGIANRGVATINCVNFGKVTCTYSDTGKVGGLASYVSTLKMDNYSCNLIENSINYGKIASYKEDYTAAIAYLYSHNSGSWHAGTKCKNNYFLETSYPRGFVGDTYNAEATMMSAKEMKAQSFLDQLNKNAKALGSGYSQWKFGKDGLPTLEFVKE